MEAVEPRPETPPATEPVVPHAAADDFVWQRGFAWYAPGPGREGSVGSLWGLLDGLLAHTTPPASPASPASQTSTPPAADSEGVPALRREASRSRRKGMPSGCQSLVPEGYVQPHPAHKQLFDGRVGGRQLHVKNFYHHFCTFQDTPFNRGAVNALEDCREYRLPAWYSSILASAANTLVEHHVQYEREELEDGDGGAVALDWAAPEDAATDAATPVLCVFPGMAGSSDKDYIRSLTQKVPRLRECGSSPVL